MKRFKSEFAIILIFFIFYSVMIQQMVRIMQRLVRYGTSEHLIDLSPDIETYCDKLVR
jgi:hypothetical protein